MTDRKNVFISGSNRGIGMATVELFAQRGWNVIAHARQPSAEFDDFLKKRLSGVVIQALTEKREQEARMKHQEFYRYKEETLDSFCKRLIKNEGKDARKEIARRAQHETLLSSLSASALAKLTTKDQYDLESWVFYVQGSIPIIVVDDKLAQALSLLNPSLRDVILLYYFLDLDMSRIALLLKISLGAVHYRYTAALVRLKEIMEKLLHE